MDDAYLRFREEGECRAQLLGKLTSQVNRDASETGVSEEVVKVKGQEFKDQAEVLSPKEMPFQFH